LLKLNIPVDVLVKSIQAENPPYYLNNPFTVPLFMKLGIRRDNLGGSHPQWKNY